MHVFVSLLAILIVLVLLTYFFQLTYFFIWCFFLFCHFLRGLCGYAKSLQYSREFVMLLQDSDIDVVDSTLFIPSDIIWHSSFMGSRCQGYKNDCGSWSLSHVSIKIVRFGNKRLWRTTGTWQRPNSDWVVGSVCISIKTGAALTLNFYLSVIFTKGVCADIYHFSVHPSKGKCWHRHSDYCRYGTQATEHHTGCTTLYFVTCSTRHMKCLHLCYGSIKGAYTVNISAEALLPCPTTVLFIWFLSKSLSRRKVSQSDVWFWFGWQNLSSTSRTVLTLWTGICLKMLQQKHISLIIQ